MQVEIHFIFLTGHLWFCFFCRVILARKYVFGAYYIILLLLLYAYYIVKNLTGKKMEIPRAGSKKFVQFRYNR